MSLINNMLKDLEKRNLKKNNLEYMPVTGRKIHYEWINQRYIIAIISIFLVLLLAAFLINKQLKTNSNQLAAPLNNTMVVNRASNKLTQHTEQALIQTVSITGVTLQVKENITELSFMLDHPVLYQLTSNGMNNSLSLIVEHAKLQSQLPPVRYLNTAIQQLTANESNEQTIINFTLIPGAAIKYVNLSSEDKNPELVVAIEYKPINSNQPTLSSTDSDIKTPVMQSLLLQKYQNALKTAEKGNYDFAINDLKDLVNADPGFIDARTSLAALLIEQGKADQASTFINKGLKINPTSSSLIELKARLLSQEGKTSQALAVLQMTHPSIEDNQNYHALLAALYERSNKDAFAVKIYQQLLSINPKNGNWWFGLGISEDKLGNKSEAINAYSRALSVGQLNSDSFAYLQKRLETLQENAHDKG